MSSTIDALAKKSTENVDVAAAALQGFQTELGKVSDAIQASAQEAAAAKKANVTTQGLAKMAEQKAVLKQATELGTNPDAASFALGALAEEYKRNNARAQGFADNIAFAMDVTNVVKSPFKYFGQLLLLDLNKEGQASAERASARTRDQYIGLNQMTQTYAQTQAAMSQNLTQDTIANEATLAAFELNRQAYAANLDKLRTGAQMTVQALNLQNQPFEIERARQASANDEARLRMAREQACNSKKDFIDIKYNFNLRKICDLLISNPGFLKVAR